MLRDAGRRRGQPAAALPRQGSGAQDVRGLPGQVLAAIDVKPMTDVAEIVRLALVPATAEERAADAA